MLNSTDNMLKLVEHSCDDYARMSSKLSYYLLDFEAEYDVPIGVHIKEVKHNLLRVGIIQVDIIPKCKKLWDNKFHKDFCE